MQDTPSTNPVVLRLRALAEPEPELSPSEKLMVAIGMHTSGVAMHRETLKRANPTASEAEIDALVHQWLAKRPGAEFGDAEGQPVLWRY